MVLHSGKKMKAVVLPSHPDSYTVMELEVGYLYEQTIPRSQIKSMVRIEE
jgi:hypothetical protein